MLDKSYMFGLAHELVFTATRKEDGTIDKDKLVADLTSQFVAVQKNGYKEGRKDAASELQKGIDELIDEFE